MTAKRLEIFVIVSIIAIIGIIYAFTQKPQSVTEVAQNQGTETSNPIPIVEGLTASATSFQYNGIDGQNALDMLEAAHPNKVDITKYDFGSFVNSIEGIKPDAKHFWAFYINDQFSQVAADKYITKSTDKIRWQMDEIKN